MDIKKREKIMQEKRKLTPFRDFVQEICSWYNFGLFRNQGLVSRYPQEDRNKNITDDLSISMDNPCIGNYTGDFFKDFYDLYSKSPKANILHYGMNENCEFSDGSYGAKNCYLSFGAGRGVEKAFYSTFVVNNCSNIFNSFCVSENCDNIYYSQSIFKSSNIYYSTQITGSYDVYFSSNLINCQNCILCDKLENQSYYIENKKYTKDEYEEKKQEILSKKYNFNKYHDFIKSNYTNIKSENISGKIISYSENIENGYYVSYAKNSRNVILFEGGEQGSQNFYDGIDVGLSSSDFYATVQAGTNANNVYCSVFIGASNVYYCMNVDDSCSYCLGCVGLKNKSFCILNKQYTKEERFKKANEIFAQMDQDGVLGNFFPGSMNPFYFNDTAAYLIDDSFTKEEVEAEGYLRRDEEIKVDIPQGAELIKSTDLDQYQGFDSEGNRQINSEILKKVIVDPKGNYYRIVKMEYDFLMKHGLPLPEIHWLDRIKLGFKFK